MKPATTVLKVCRVMDQFRGRQALGIAELARRTGFLPSDVHRILTSLRSVHYIDQDPETKKYRLGVGLVHLGLTAFRGNLLREKAQPVLAQVSRRLAATTHLALFERSRLELLLIAQTDGPAPAMLPKSLGEMEYLHCTALGKAILAGLDRDALGGVLQVRGMPRITRNTITDAAALHEQLAEVRQRGYAVDCEELQPGLCCIGSPIRDRASTLLGAISVSVPASRFLDCNPAHLGTVLKAAADDLGAAFSTCTETC